MVADAAHRALGLLISKDKTQGGMPYKVFTKLYNALVQSISDYGVAIWGYKEFSSINAFQNRACRYLSYKKQTHKMGKISLLKINIKLNDYK